MEWVENIFGFQVEQREIKRPQGKPYFMVANTSIGVLHTTEGSTVVGAWDTLNASFSAPHFITGEHRIIQCRPLNVQGAALHSHADHNPNKEAHIQIEMVSHSQQSLWLPSEATLQPTVAVMAFCAQHLGIPLAVPAPWPDNCADVSLPWAANNSRRQQAAAGLWPSAPGWWMHLEIPWQNPTWHWDCGALRRSVLIQKAQELL